MRRAFFIFVSINKMTRLQCQLMIRKLSFNDNVAVMKVKDENEAVEYANKNRCGLGAYIFSKDIRKAKDLARKIDMGSICINDVDVNYVISSLPFGGFKESGIGKVLGPEGIRSYMKQQSLVIDKLKLKREIWWYPYTDQTYKLLCRFIIKPPGDEHRQIISWDYRGFPV